MGGSCWPLSKQGNAWSHRDLFDAGNHFKGKEENLKHTQKHVNVLSATTTSNKPIVWMSKSDPLQKINSCLRVNKIDSIEESALQEINWCLRVNEIDPIEESALQKINLPQGHRNRPHQRRHPSKRETKTCLKVNEIDFTKKYTARNKLIPRSQQNRLHQRRLPKRSKKNKKQTCLKVIEIDLTKRRTLQKINLP